ncbi:hypothetical protein CU098_006242 [Rhizopus stolonifer]|uniref:Cytochrome P450 n=1 Tax=Rhizopus stolonifer TaxID=4846 RepID=A0A367KR64_RHIST|nr:hypothetical protein CU098_006242 [Rhizopus stolonifer]
MNNLTEFVKSTPIQAAIDLVQRAPAIQKLVDVYSHSSRNEVAVMSAISFFTLYRLIGFLKSATEKRNLPPKVPFSLPIVGHTLFVMLWPNQFLDWCNDKYGEIYRLDYLGKTVTVTNGKCAEQSLKADSSELSIEHGILREVLHFHYVFDRKTMDIGFHVNPIIIKNILASHKMPRYIPDIQRGLERAVEKKLSQDKPTIVTEPSLFLQHFVAYMSIPTLLGKELVENPEVIKTFAEFTGDISNNVGIFLAVPTCLHRFILPYLQSVRKHHQVMYKYVVPVILARREKMKQAEEAGEDANMDVNFLQGLIEHRYTSKDGTAETFTNNEIANAVLLIAFASVHTTSMNLSFCLYYLLNRPDLMEQMVEEIQRVIPDDRPIDEKVLSEMKFLNNLIREVLKQGADKLAFAKKAMQDFVFHNGYIAPEGQSVYTNLRQLNFGNNVTRAQPEDMDPRMSMDKTATTPSKDFVPFGMGKHLCPGKI